MKIVEINGTNYSSTGNIALNIAKKAREEGFEQIAKQFEGVAKIEKSHELRYRTLLKNIEEGQVYARENEVVWVCRNCGHLVIGTKAPEVCPVCDHPQAYFEVREINY